MTNDYKSLLLKYLTGNLTNDYDVSTMNPYYENVDYQTKPSSEGFPSGVSIQCLDGEGKPNGKNIFYEPNFGTKLYLVDNDMNILHTYESWNTGTDFQRFLKLGVDEEGQFYGIDYDSNTQKYRFILMNNISEPTKMPNGSLQYRAVLRNSYFIQGYTNEDDISPDSNVYLGKANGMATYYFAFTDSTLENIMPSTLTINVGAANEWNRLQDILVSQGAKTLDTIIYFNSEGIPYVSYFVYDLYLSNKIKRIDVVGDGTPNSIDLIDINYVESSLSQLVGSFLYDPHALEYNLIALSTTQYYFIIRGYVKYGGSYPCNQWVILYRDGYQPLDYVWINRQYRGAAGGDNSRLPLVSCSKNDNGDLSMFYRLIDDTTDTYDKLFFTFIPNNPKHTLPKKFFDIETDTTIYNVVASRVLVSSTFNLIKGIHQNGVYGEGTIKNTIVSFIYNDDNYNTEHFEKNGGDTRTLLPNQGILFNANNKPIFARNLYNLKTYKNKSTSVLNVPNNVLNDININKNLLVSMFNNEIVENTDSIEKNIYEDLYINYFNTLTMQDRNTDNYVDNLEGAIRLNQSSNKVCDYEDAKATKIKITYNDGSYLLGGIDNTITNDICTYEFYVYVPNNKEIEKIDIISEDEGTIYQTIKEFPITLEATKTYKIQQDVYVG